MPLLFTSFPGFQTIRTVKVTDAAVTRIDITGLNITNDHPAIILFSGVNINPGGSDISLYAEGDEEATDYNTTTNKPVLNVMTQSTANNAIVLALPAPAPFTLTGYIFIYATDTAIMQIEETIATGGNYERRLIGQASVATAGAVTSLSIVSNIANDIEVGSEVVILQKV